MWVLVTAAALAAAAPPAPPADPLASPENFLRELEWEDAPSRRTAPAPAVAPDAAYNEVDLANRMNDENFYKEVEEYLRPGVEEYLAQAFAREDGRRAGDQLPALGVMDATDAAQDTAEPIYPDPSPQPDPQLLIADQYQKSLQMQTTWPKIQTVPNSAMRVVAERQRPLFADELERWRSQTPPPQMTVQTPVKKVNPYLVQQDPVVQENPPTTKLLRSARKPMDQITLGPPLPQLRVQDYQDSAVQALATASFYPVVHPTPRVRSVRPAAPRPAKLLLWPRQPPAPPPAAAPPPPDTAQPQQQPLIVAAKQQRIEKFMDFIKKNRALLMQFIANKRLQQAQVGIMGLQASAPPAAAAPRADSKKAWNSNLGGFGRIVKGLKAKLLNKKPKPGLQNLLIQNAPRKFRLKAKEAGLDARKDNLGGRRDELPGGDLLEDAGALGQLARPAVAGALGQPEDVVARLLVTARQLLPPEGAPGTAPRAPLKVNPLYEEIALLRQAIRPVLASDDKNGLAVVTRPSVGAKRPSAVPNQAANLLANPGPNLGANPVANSGTNSAANLVANLGANEGANPGSVANGRASAAPGAGASRGAAGAAGAVMRVQSESKPPRVRLRLDARLLDMAPAKGELIEVLRNKNRLCQRHVLLPEGPKYRRDGRAYMRAYAPRPGHDFARTRPPRLLLPACCNCCAKSALGCE